MLRSLQFAFFVVFVCGSDVFGVTLVKDGKPAAVIVISDEAFQAKPVKPTLNQVDSPAVKAHRAALELQKYVEKISGAVLPIAPAGQGQPAGGVVLVGDSTLVIALGVKTPTGLTPARKDEEYIIRATKDTLILAGDDAGPYECTFYAVSEFLNRLGVRWFMPSEFGEVTPKMATIEVGDMDFRDKPDFFVRSWGGNMAPWLIDDDVLFRLHNKLTIHPNSIISIPGDSYLRQYLPDKELLKTHPEYWAKRLDGSVDPAMVNLSNPEVPRLVAEKVKEKIKKTREKDPTFNSLGFAPDDGLPMDLSAETMKKNLGFTDLVGREGVVTELSVSEEWFNFVNKVTEEVVKEYPGFIVTTNGYTNRTTPPEGVAIHPNMGIMFAAIWADLLHSFDDPKSWQQQVQGQMIKRWATLSPRVFVYNYNFPMLVTGLTPMPLTRKIARNTPLMKDWGVFGFEDEQTFSWMAHGITSFYLRGKLYWHAHEDAKAILDDYFKNWYGPAAKPSQAYWDAIEEAIESTPLLGHEDRILPYVYTAKLIADLEGRQAEAEQLAVAEPYVTHVRIDRLILDHLKAYLALNRAEFTGDYPEAIKQTDIMFAQRAALNKISGYFYIPESKNPREVYWAGSHYWNLTSRREHYEKVRAMTSGKTGELVAKAPRKVAFAIDDLDIGRYARWHEPDFDRSKWKMIDTATPFYLQGDNLLDKRGAPYVGFVWYVFEFSLDKDVLTKPIHVFAPIVSTEAWVWTNGAFTGHRPYAEGYIRPQELDFDVTTNLKPRKNVIAVRVSTSQSRMQAAEGFQGPLFLYAPLKKGEAK